MGSLFECFKFLKPDASEIPMHTKQRNWPQTVGEMIQSLWTIKRRNKFEDLLINFHKFAKIIMERFSSNNSDPDGLVNFSIINPNFCLVPGILAIVLT